MWNEVLSCEIQFVSDGSDAMQSSRLRPFTLTPDAMKDGEEIISESIQSISIQLFKIDSEDGFAILKTRGEYN